MAESLVESCEKGGLIKGKADLLINVSGNLGENEQKCLAEARIETKSSRL